MKCNDCGQSRGVRLCQGDLDLCKKCEAKRFPAPSSSSSKHQDKDKMADREEQSQFSQILSTLASLSDKIEKIPTVERKLNDLQASVEYISTFFDMYKERMENIEAENKSLKEQLVSINDNLTTTQQELRDLQQYTRRNNLEIHGVPEQPDEDTDSLVVKVANSAGIHISTSDIDISHRLPSRTHAHPHPRPAPIIVKFTRRTIRNNIYSARKHIKNKSTRDMNIDNHTDTRIYINENLSPANKQLFYKANEKKKSLQWKFIWTMNGNILVRKNEESRAIRITSVNDIERLQYAH
ncbi:uncharacterized protein LOC144439215 [Glandiceps talaboti]